MTFRKLLISILALSTAYTAVNAQGPAGRREMMPADSWEVNVRQMPDSTRVQITEAMSRLRGAEADRGIIADVGRAVGLGLVSGVVDAVVTETFSLMQYRKKQKAEWMRMIQNENNYTDSITSIKGLRDFYTANSSRGALDPSDINFDGIEIRGMRDGHEVIYMSCSIDRDRLDHMFRHSKFNLVIDTLAFYPYQCHLPNVTANGIRTMRDLKEGDAEMKGDTIIRPGKGGNGFSFDERKDLRVAIDFSLTSSWINEAVQVHKDVELGKFNFTINIPDSVLSYKYSRKKVIAEALQLPAGPERDRFLNQNLLSVEGDCFVVPRSYMPLGNGNPMWGTGEYNIKVKIRESCQFADNSDKAKHWREDYKRLRQMQKRSGEVREYFQTLWNQYGNSLVKSTYKTALTTVANDLTAPLLGGASGGQSMSAMGAKAAAAAQGAQGAQGQSPQGTQSPQEAQTPQGAAPQGAPGK